MENKIKTIKKFSFISMTLWIVAIICLFAIYMRLFSYLIINFDFYFGFSNRWNILIWVLGTISVISGVSSFILNIINAISILSTNWKLSEIENQKTIWGIFTIIILGWIASLVFSTKASNVINDSKNQQKTEKE